MDDNNSIISFSESFLQEVDCTKAELKGKAQSIMDEIKESGDFSLVNYARLRQYKEFIDSLESLMRDEAYSEMNGAEESLDLGNVKLGLSSTGERLNYEVDPVYAELLQKLKNREKILKLRQTDESINVTKVPVKTPSKGFLKSTLK
jgi:hypothetical protein